MKFKILFCIGILVSCTIVYINPMEWDPTNSDSDSSTIDLDESMAEQAARAYMQQLSLKGSDTTLPTSKIQHIPLNFPVKRCADSAWEQLKAKRQKCIESISVKDHSGGYGFEAKGIILSLCPLIDKHLSKIRNPKKIFLDERFNNIGIQEMQALYRLLKYMVDNLGIYKVTNDLITTFNRFEAKQTIQDLINDLNVSGWSITEADIDAFNRWTELLKAYTEGLFSQEVNSLIEASRTLELYFVYNVLKHIQESF